LDHLDWTAGTVLIQSSKTARERLLPMSEEVGGALAAYLTKGRPPSSERLVFLGHHRPYAPLRATAVVSGFVNSLLKQTGILAPCTGAHVLRHTLATGMVCQGATFKDVADILGHRCLTTTGINAKLDLPTLAQVALPWPGETQ
jgi:site-specific recombinase XerD